MAERLPREHEPLPLTLAVARGRVVVRQGEACAGLWAVEAGAMFASAVASDGHGLALDVLGPGDAVGEPEGLPSAVTVLALRPCRLRPVRPREAPALLAARAVRAAELACRLAWLRVDERLTSRLDDLADRFGREVPGGIWITLRLSQEELAALAGTTRESVNRALRAMERDGRLAVEGRGRYVVRSSLRPARTATRADPRPIDPRARLSARPAHVGPA